MQSPTIEDMVIVESKDYAQVVFDDIKECYGENQPLECLFTLNDLLKADTSDYVGIYKVGFTNCKEHICFLPINMELIKENKGKLTFDSETLPKDDGDFYQFVYVSQGKQIRGASIPFQFKRAHLSDFVEVEENEAIVIKSKESAINDTITEIKIRCMHLSNANDTYEKLVKENEDLIKSLKEEVGSIKMRCYRLTMDNEKINFILKNKADHLKNLAETIANLTNENLKLQNRFDDLTNENKNLIESLQHRIDQVALLKSELEKVKLSKEELISVLNLKESELSQLKTDKDELNRIADDLQRINENIVSLEKQVDSRVVELTNIKEDLKKNEALVNEQAHMIGKILSERDTLNNMIQKLTKEKNALECNQENLSQELSMSKDKLMAAEQCKEMLRAQLIVANNELIETNSKLNGFLSQVKEFSQKERQFQEDKVELLEKMKQIKSEYELKLEQSNGSYFALRTAHAHLETRLKSIEQKNEKSEKESEIQKQNINKLQQENDELKERILAGAKEYSKLFEKYRLIKNQQFNYDMNVYHDLNGDIHMRRNLNSNKLTQSQYRHSTPNEEQDVDSAIQDKTVSQSARASSADIENTLLDALLCSSLYNGNWNNNNQAEFNPNSNWNPMNKHMLNLQNIAKPMPAHSSSKDQNEMVHSKSQHQINSDVSSDDGLVHLANPNNYQANNNANEVYSNEQDFMKLNVNGQFAKQNINQTASNQTNNKEEDDNVFSESSKLVRQLENKMNLQVNNEQKNFDYTNMRTCDICNYIFPTDCDVNEIEKHYTVHYGPSCPVCFLTFHKGYPQEEFELHVNSHF